MKKYLIISTIILIGFGMMSCSQKTKDLADSKKDIDMEDKVIKTEAEWKEILTPAEFNVLRGKGTERAFTGKYTYNKEKGIYSCAACGAELFKSDSKYDSGCGWPSFTEPVNERCIVEKLDTTYGMIRTEIICARCDSHLGHVFNDGPGNNGLRYCVNSVSMDFEGE